MTTYLVLTAAVSLLWMLLVGAQRARERSIGTTVGDLVVVAVAWPVALLAAIVCVATGAYSRWHKT